MHPGVMLAGYALIACTYPGNKRLLRLARMPSWSVSHASSIRKKYRVIIDYLVKYDYIILYSRCQGLEAAEATGEAPPVLHASTLCQSSGTTHVNAGFTWPYTKEPRFHVSLSTTTLVETHARCWNDPHTRPCPIARGRHTRPIFLIPPGQVCRRGMIPGLAQCLGHGAIVYSRLPAIGRTTTPVLGARETAGR